MYERTCGVRPHILRRPFRIGTVVFRPIAFFGWSRDFFFFFFDGSGWWSNSMRGIIVLQTA